MIDEATIAMRGTRWAHDGQCTCCAGTVVFDKNDTAQPEQVGVLPHEARTGWSVHRRTLAACGSTREC